METSYSILVNTTDSFEDCWEPFFKLFATYWSDFKGKVYLNTEYKEFHYPGIDIVSIKNSEHNDRGVKNTWSECLIRALNTIQNDVVLYMQEDYFFQSAVDNKEVDKYAAIFRAQDMDCLHLTPASGSGPFEGSPYPDIWTIGRRAQCRLSCQAAFWKKTILLKYIRSYESPWQFETFGTLRAYRINDHFYNISLDLLKKKEILPYLRTGVVQGKWKTDVVPLFSNHDISVDFSRRGFLQQRKLNIPERIRAKFKRLPSEIRNRIDLIKLSYSLFLSKSKS